MKKRELRNLMAVLATCLSIECRGQDTLSYQLRSVVFYNLENLFDTENDSLTHDDARTPDGRDRWTTERYRQKVSNLSEILAAAGGRRAGVCPDLIGLCEVENYKVLADLVRTPALARCGYGIIHENSPDERGIDVAFLYKKAAFSPYYHSSVRLVLLDEEGERNYTRDVLVVSGLLDGEAIHLLINHWPSRSGGQKRSAPYRQAAALLNRGLLDSLAREYQQPKILLMGDLNDNPTDDSLKKVLRAKGDTAEMKAGTLFNPMEAIYRKGGGSLAYRDRWSLFDQILLSNALIRPPRGSYGFWKAGIYSPPILTVRKGRYRGYPKRSYAGGRYSPGYSDHFPVFAYLIRRRP